MNSWTGRKIQGLNTTSWVTLPLDSSPNLYAERLTPRRNFHCTEIGRKRGRKTMEAVPKAFWTLLEMQIEQLFLSNSVCLLRESLTFMEQYEYVLRNDRPRHINPSFIAINLSYGEVKIPQVFTFGIFMTTCIFSSRFTFLNINLVRYPNFKIVPPQCARSFS